MFASTFLSRLTNSKQSPLLPLSSSSSSSPAPYTDTIIPSPTDASATLLALARQEAHLQGHIQYLLDIQSDRLLEGLGETHPQTSQAPSKNVSPLQKGSAKAEPLSLQQTRKEITVALSSLHSLKSHTSSLLSSSLSSTSQTLSSISALQSRKQALEAKIQELETSPASTELDGWCKEEEALGREIYEIENRLFELKARRRVLRQQVQEGRNREDARVSSYRRALEMVGGEVGEVVGRKPVGGVASSDLLRDRKGETRGGGEGREGVWDLPPRRRTLDMVLEYYKHEKRELGTRIRDLEKEEVALEEGGKVWGEVVTAVGDLEVLLEKEMSALVRESNNTGRREGMERVLGGMKEARERVEGRLRMAEEKGWKLLIVCIEAEAEALAEGEAVLRNVLGVEGENETFSYVTDGRDGAVGEGEARIQENGSVRNPDGHVEEQQNGMNEEMDDDEPGPELLMSMQEEELGPLRI